MRCRPQNASRRRASTSTAATAATSRSRAFSASMCSPAMLPLPTIAARARDKVVSPSERGAGFVSTLRIVHALGAHVDILWGEMPLARYVHRPDVPQLESPKPYLRPVRTLTGDLVTAYRPHDHVWHKGIQLALPHVGGENFWGGVTWVRGEGYRQLDNNGSMDHVEFEALEADGQRARIAERLAWRTQAGEHWIDERRTLGFRVLGDAWV